MRPRVYADFNATTPPSAAVIQAMQAVLGHWGNPASAHEEGRKALKKLEDVRVEVAKLAHCDPTEVVFTSGGSEANGLALMGHWLAHPEIRILSTPIEHSSVRDTLDALALRGASVERVPVGRGGGIDLEAFQSALDRFRPDLVSCMAANNETGVVYPIAGLAELCRERGVLLHTDAVQALGKLPTDLFSAADFYSLSAHKIQGPKGVGALVLKRSASARSKIGERGLSPIVFGGSQELKRRGGTHAMPAIAGFGAACTEFPNQFQPEQVATLRDRFESHLASIGAEIVGGRETRLPNTSMVRFPGVSGESMLGALDLAGIAASAGSACSSGSIQPSHVLLSMGLTREEARECVRFSWGASTTEADVDTVSGAVIEHVNRVRARQRNRS